MSLFKKKFPFYSQLDSMDCGPTCLRMIAKYYGKSFSLDYLREITQYEKAGVSLLSLAEAAELIGLKAVGVKLSFEELIRNPPSFPAILYWDQYHFVVLTPYSKKNKLIIADPAKGIVTLNRKDFLKKWISTIENGQSKGVALLLQKMPHFNEDNLSDFEDKKSKIGTSYLLRYIKQHKNYFFQIAVGVLIGNLIQLIFPYLTQSLVDNGINNKDIRFIQVVLVAQLMLLFSQTVIEFVRSKIILFISTRINISLLSGFWSKLLKLPIQFFDSRHPGDILQRIGDYTRIEKFITGSALNTLFSLVNLFMFSIVLFTYNTSVFLIFLLGSILSFIWIRFFLKHRRKLDYERFSIAAKENNATMQLVYGMQEIKLNNAENTYRWAWEGLQTKIFKLTFKSLSLTQYQQLGAFLITQGKNILITFIVAKLVIEGELTIGAMLAIQYIVGQLNSPVDHLIGFMQEAQDAKISLERLNDIHEAENEEPNYKTFKRRIPETHSLTIKNLFFSYPGAGNESVLKNINLVIPQGKVTAIVGTSGSGKSTLIRLLLKFYDSYEGEIKLGEMNFKELSSKYWRNKIGVVMQDNFIFNDNIQNNIVISSEKVNKEKLITACKTANILSYIDSLPLGFSTKLGVEGKSISGGQKQRICIARAIYKDPQFIILDEATNSLDANNEKIILKNLQNFFKGKTVVVVAHRLSTVKNADKIVVLENGYIVEEGTHTKLSAKKGKYYELVKNQLELGD